jgi:hypothetical protein
LRHMGQMSHFIARSLAFRMLIVLLDVAILDV